MTKISDMTLRPSKLLFYLFFALAAIRQSAAQNLYISGYYFPANGPTSYMLGVYDIETCTFCPEFTIPAATFPGVMKDVVPLPNGQVVVIGSNVIGVYDPPGNAPSVSLVIPGINSLRGAVLAPNGNVYVTALIQGSNGIWDSKVYEYNPVNNTAVLVGTFPAPTNQQLFQPFYWNGLLHAFMRDVTNNSYHLVTIDLGNPMVLNIVSNFGNCGAPAASITSGPYAGIYTGDCSGNDIYKLELPANTTELVCVVSVPPSCYCHGMGEVPPGYPSYNCLCLTTDAGTLAPQTLTVCTNESAIFTHNGNEVLEPDDLLQYILFSNPADTLGSILATSNTPTFTFDPATMQTDVTYYVAAIAGNNLNGNVDLNDPCLNISNAVTVVWQPKPSLASFAASNPNGCPGACREVSVTLNGTPPFTLSGELLSNGAPVGNFTESFSSNSGQFTVCVPPGTNSGAFLIRFTFLLDANCASCD